MRRPALGKGVDALFEVTKPDRKEPKERPSSKLPKFKTFEVKLSILLRTDQLEFLNRLEKRIMRSRSPENKRERITKNTIIRCAIDLISRLNIDIEEIADERELLKRMGQAL
jgi:hypothetical protein